MSSSVDTDLSALSFWSKPRDERDAAFAHLRAHDPVSWQRQPESVLMESEGTGGYWAVVGYDDIRAVSRASDTFGSAEGITMEDTPPEFLEASQSIIAMDNPRHAAVRGLVQKAFSPRTVRKLEEGIRADAAEILDRLDGVQEGDFVSLVAKWLPLMTIMRMLGVPESEQEHLVHHADSMVSWNDPDYLQGRDAVAVIGEAIMVLHGAAQQLAAAREAEPEDDLLTALVQAEVDGRKLTHAEIGSFFVLLTVAGNDTTRHATSHSAVALTRHRDQRDLLLADLDGALETAVEEFVRWATPVMTMRRTTRHDTTIGATEVAEGDKVVLFYPSGNRDERAFADPDRFDVTRDPNRHLGFGGGGAHYCLGASLARTQLRALFGELLRRYPDFEVGDPHYLVGNFVDGVSRLDFRPGARVA